MELGPPIAKVPGARALPSGQGVTTVGLALTRDLQRGKFVDLRGTIVRTSEDLAAVAQIWRNPKFETFRVIYLKDLEIMGHEAVSSRKPNFVDVTRGHQKQWLSGVYRAMERLGANNFFILHNHPSRELKPSNEDLEFTISVWNDKDFGKAFTAHIIIDHPQRADGRVSRVCD